MEIIGFILFAFKIPLDFLLALNLEALKYPLFLFVDLIFQYLVVLVSMVFDHKTLIDSMPQLN